jgi:hypothetical protein
MLLKATRCHDLDKYTTWTFTAVSGVVIVSRLQVGPQGTPGSISSRNKG